MDGTSPQIEPRPPKRAVALPRREPLLVRKQRERKAARARVVARTTRGLTVEQLANDPLIREYRSPLARFLAAVGALLGSSAVHGGIVVLGLLLGSGSHGRREVVEQEVEIKVADRPPPPPPPPEVKAPEPPKAIEKPRVQPRIAKAPPPPAEPVHTPPPRVVGLSLESTTEGGSGPSFAVGNTREGKTADKAEAPKDVPKEAPPVTDEPAPGTNQVAHRLPVAGVTYTQPKRINPDAKPPYPEKLKSQGIEANVVVTVMVDPSGKVSSVKISKSSGFPEFDEVARKFVAAEAYEPGTRDGKPVAYPLAFTVKFRLDDQ